MKYSPHGQKSSFIEVDIADMYICLTNCLLGITTIINNVGIVLYNMFCVSVNTVKLVILLFIWLFIWMPQCPVWRNYKKKGIVDKLWRVTSILLHMYIDIQESEATKKMELAFLYFKMQQ